jgi:hypothetical protein
LVAPGRLDFVFKCGARGLAGCEQLEASGLEAVALCEEGNGLVAGLADEGLYGAGL